MPYYLQSLRTARDAGAEIISAPTVAAQLGLNEVQVRKDFASVSNTAGKPKTGFQTRELISAIESCLGYDNSNDAVLVGAGSLGRALLSYRGFEEYGLSIVTAFDVDPNLTGGEISGKQVLPMTNLPQSEHSYRHYHRSGFTSSGRLRRAGGKRCFGNMELRSRAS
jgi:redox-sensing transcriptional repressor